MEIANDEIRSPRDLQRSVKGVLEDLHSERVDKIVLMRFGKLEGVILTPDKYEELLNGQAADS